MFSNLQNKIDLKRIKEDNIEIDSEFAFKEDFDIVNQTLSYFQNKKNEPNNISIKEEVIEFENEDVFSFLEKTVADEQKFIYNNEQTLETLKEEELIFGGKADGMTVEDIARKHGVTVDQINEQIEKGMKIEFEHVNDGAKAKEIAKDHLDEFPDYYDRLEDMEAEAKAIHESYVKYHKVRGLLPTLMEEANMELRQHLDSYRMVDGEYADESISVMPDNNEYDVKALFDSNMIDVARKEYLDQIYTTNWLEKQLIDYRKVMNDSMIKGSSFQIDNGLQRLDVNDTDEIKNKIKDLQESIKFLKAKTGDTVLNEGIGVITWLLSALSPIFGGIYASQAVKGIVKNTLMQKPSFAKKVEELHDLKAKAKNKDRQKELIMSIKQEINTALSERKITI